MRQSSIEARGHYILKTKDKVFFEVTGEVFDSELGRGFEVKLLTMSLATEESPYVIRVLDQVKEEIDQIEEAACHAIVDSYSFEVEPSNWSDFWEKVV